MGSSQDGADVSTKKDFIFGGIENFDIDESGTPMVQENNTGLNYVAKLDPATQIKNYVYENEV